MKDKNVYIIAGPNGCGKTTFAKRFLPNYVKCNNFINADLIAGGLSPFLPRMAAMKAGRIMLAQMHSMAGKNIDFAFETTLADRSYLPFLKRLKNRGYAIHVFFLWVPVVELALGRIKERVAGGGHNVPAQDVRRRFKRGCYNLFNLYKPLLDSWMLFDNSAEKPLLIAKGKNGEVVVEERILFRRILEDIGVNL